MRCPHTFARVDQRLATFQYRQGLLPGQTALEATAGDIFQIQIRCRLLGTDLVDGHYVGMIELARGLSLRQEPPPRRRVGRQMISKNLDRDIAFDQWVT